MLTGNRDVDMEILQQLEDKDLVNVCQTNRYSRNLCNNQLFWMNRVLRKFRVDINLLKKYKGDRSWADYYIKDLRKIRPLNGDSLAEQMFVEDAAKGRLDRIMIRLKISGDLSHDDILDEAFVEASMNNRMDTAKFLLQKGADIDAWQGDALISSAEHGHLDMVKFLVENGADIHARNDHAFVNASAGGHLEIVKYLVEKGADVEKRAGIALEWAELGDHKEVVDYLLRLIN